MDDERLKTLVVEATEEQQQFAERAALLAALNALKDLDSETDSPKRMVDYILRAFDAASKVTADAKKAANKNQGDGPHVFLAVNVRHVVASALRGRIRLPYVPDPYSVGGAELVAFASACALLEARSNLNAAADCEGFGDYLADEVLAEFEVDDEDHKGKDDGKAQPPEPIRE